ncbi:uncharacterized protein LOC141814021 isoform X1 [Curcuma longa]|uniref:uncharacterized protein LOC141814021 isoform X1 n=1 Tax=Curcuma longa TaxID=136217 RepID=UPI003D9EE10B
MDRHRNERFDDRFGDGGGRRPPSRWSSGSPTERQPRYTRSGTGSGGEGFAGGNSGAGGRYHPYRAMQDLPPPPAAAGFPGGDPGGFGPAPPVSGPRRGFSARGGSPEFLEFRLKTNVTSNLYHLPKWSMLSVEHLMSARDSFFLGSIGLLGEYCPTSRKKYTCPSEKFDYLHVEPFQEAYNPNQGYNSEEFLSVVPSQYCIKTNRNLVSTSIA